MKLDLAEAWSRPGVLEGALLELGLEPRARGARFEVRCPSCGERRAWCSRPRGSEAPAVRCNRRNTCGASAPVWTLLLERMGRARAEEVLGLGGAPRAPGAPNSAPAVRPEPKVERPPRAELEALWDAAEELDPARADHQSIVRLLEAKATDPRNVLGLAKVLPRPGSCRWPAWWPSSWSSTHRLGVRLFDAEGALSAIQARRTEGDLAAKPRQRMPLGCGRYGFGGLFMACPAGAAWLRREIELEEIALVEGLTDWLRLSSSPLAVERRLAVLGMVNGSQPAIGALPWRPGMRVKVLTDRDPAGDRYATEIAALVPSTVRVERG